MSKFSQKVQKTDKMRYDTSTPDLGNEFEDKWNVYTRIEKGSVTVMYAGEVVLYANLEKKRIVYDTGGPFLKEEFVEEFKTLVRRIKHAVN